MEHGNAEVLVLAVFGEGVPMTLIFIQIRVSGGTLYRA